MTPLNLYEAYAAVYDENLREDLVSVEEDLEFIDDLSDNELVEIMEEILSEEEVTLQECLEVFDEVLSEARVDMAARIAARKKYAAASEKSAKEARGRAAAKEKSERRAERVERIKSSAKRAAENVKTKAAGVASAAAGGAAEAGRAARGAAKAAKAKVTGKLASAKERIKGLVKSGRSAVAGGLRKAASKIEPKETEKKAEKKSAPVGTSENPRVGQPGKERKALPAGRSKPDRRIAAAQKLAIAAKGSGPSGTVQKGQPAGTFKSKRSRAEAQKREARLSANESLELLDLIVQDLINEGYVHDEYEAYDLIEEMDINETSDLVESYLIEEVEDREDLFDYIMEYLVVEGYADTNQNAIAIMSCMSEEWRESIVEEVLDEARTKSYSAKEARKGHDIGKPGKMFAKIAKKAGKQYGSQERGEKVAGAVLAKLRAKH